MVDTMESLKTQIIEAGANVQYTYVAHWIIVNRLRKWYKLLKIIQIALTALSTGGFMATIVSGVSKLAWVGGLTSALALAINLYMLNFNLPESIKQHIDAANSLWEIREKYKSLIVDFDSIEIIEVRERRDTLIGMVSRVNKEYPGTDENSFVKAQSVIERYKFDALEAAKVMMNG